MDNLYLVMPAYNEEENIKDVIEQWYPVVRKIGADSRLVIMDDGSKDSTYQTALEYTRQYPQLTVLTKENQGHGPTVLRLYQYAIDQGADFIFQTDSDGQTLPEEFWKLWKNREKCGLLLGYRKGRQDGASRVFVTKVLKIVLFLLFHEWITDANVPFRLMRASQLKEVMKKVPKDYNLCNVLISVIYTKHKMGVFYTPITFRPRQGGVNSINMKRIFKIGKQAVKDFAALKKSI